MRVIIPAAGEGRRWGMHGGIRKHQATVRGVPLLARLIGQFNADGVRPLVLTHPDHPYTYAGADYRPVEPDHRSSIDKVLSSRPWWATDDDTLIMFGDVYLSKAGFAAAVQPRTDWVVFGRISRSRYSRKGRSFFGMRFAAHEHEFVATVGGQVAAADTGHSPPPPRRGRLAIWYQVATGQPVTRRLVDAGHLVVIDDESDDVDRPRDLMLLRRAVREVRRGR